jgi:hypothetical protein
MGWWLARAGVLAGAVLIGTCSSDATQTQTQAIWQCHRIGPAASCQCRYDDGSLRFDDLVGSCRPSAETPTCCLYHSSTSSAFTEVGSPLCECLDTADCEAFRQNFPDITAIASCDDQRPTPAP